MNTASTHKTAVLRLASPPSTPWILASRCLFKRLAPVLFAASLVPTGACNSCDQDRRRCIQNENLRRKGQPAKPPPLKVESTEAVPPGTLTVGELRRKISQKGIHRVAGVLLRDTKKALECLKNQSKHGRSCPPPYHIIGDVAPFSGDEIPNPLGDRVLVRMVPEPKGIERGKLYVIHGFWCPDGVLARFCARKIHEVAPKGGRTFWEERARAAAQKAASRREEAQRKKKRALQDASIKKSPDKGDPKAPHRQTQ